MRPTSHFPFFSPLPHHLSLAHLIKGVVVVEKGLVSESWRRKREWMEHVPRHTRKENRPYVSINTLYV